MTIVRTATPSTARAINDRVALDLLVQGPLTAAQLKAHTGLSRPTVADLLDRLQRAGLVTVVGESGDERRGPNARLYGIVADRAHTAAVDVRTESVSVAVADLTGRTVAAADLPVPPGTPSADAVPRTLTTLRATLRRAGVAAVHTVAVGAPGLIDPGSGQLSATGALPAWHTDLVAALRAELDAPVLLENEVNLAGIAEQRTGAAQDRDTFVLLWLGHGIGAAVILDGRLRRGASGGTGELAFLPVPGTGRLPSPPACDGGFHDLAGSAAVCALARQHGLAPGPARDAAAAEAVVRRARAAGPRGAAFLDALAARIAIGAAAVTCVLDPGCVVLGGEVGQAGGQDLADRVADHLARISPLRTEVRSGTAQGSSVLAGAILTATDAAHRDLFGTP
ncbi:ROK family transcriptional regulator [Allostreptomyces psammosilenae]|uniref:Putative NBD/HSP70 family sugar kinase n=1 Tax=Allostreptomyces psammosilenae TaxID=1892865 RepID=A0A852ZQY9_9ACTN|nr:ROK family transcriptional regulator [Allostreptomyces psammosilenae]NYI04813.1 putative NBD/HSP70 family sugar kinase [Allostreptomyces psammosilenae]